MAVAAGSGNPGDRAAQVQPCAPPGLALLMGDRHEILREMRPFGERPISSPGDATGMNVGPRHLFAIHLLTASGAAASLLAVMASFSADWTTTFVWLGVALFIDGIDGPIARRYRVRERLPKWDGAALDFVIDYTTYVFVPAIVVARALALPPLLGAFCGIVVAVSGALYFADVRMKLGDNCFRGFPVLWNAAAFYLFLLKPPPWIGAAGVVVLLVLTFVPFPFIHPIRVTRWRRTTLAIGMLGAVLAAAALLYDLNPPLWIRAALTAIGFYFFAAGLARRYVGDLPHA